MKKHGQCYFLTYVRPEKKFGLIFSNFWPIFRHLPPLFVALSQKVSCATFQNYQISMYNSNTDSLGLILGVEVFFSIGHCSGALWYAKTIYILGKTCIFLIKKISANFSRPKS